MDDGRPTLFPAGRELAPRLFDDDERDDDDDARLPALFLEGLDAPRGALRDEPREDEPRDDELPDGLRDEP